MQQLAQSWQIVREVDVAGLSSELSRPVQITVFGSDRESAQCVAPVIQAGAEYPLVKIRTLEEGEAAGDDARLIALGSRLSAAARQTLTRLIARSPCPLVVYLPTWTDSDPLGLSAQHAIQFDPKGDPRVERTHLLAGLVSLQPGSMLALGRQFPALRDPVAERLIRDAGVANAQFATLSNLPAVVPLLGGVAGNVADLVVLTKNQILLTLKLAGLHGRDVHNVRNVLLEVAPVVGSAFVWRTAARSLAGLLPAPLSVVPKGVVAFTGTVVVGQSAHYYFKNGRRPPADFARQVAADASEGVRGTFTERWRKRPFRHRAN